MNILGISGSLRAESFNTRLLAAAATLFPDGVGMKTCAIGDLPHYNQDLEADDLPVVVATFKEAIVQSDAILIATPEYNFSIPGVLKNAIDWASRPTFKSPLVNKPAGIISASLAVTGGARAQSHLKQVLAGTLTPVYAAPEYLVGSAHGVFDDNGELNDDELVRRLRRFVEGFIAWGRDLANNS